MDTNENIDQAIANLAASLAEKPVVADPVALLKDYITTNEAKGVAERHLKELKPKIESLRTGKTTSFFGKLSNKIGNFIITNVTSSQKFASVEVLDGWLAKGKITAADYAEAVKSVPKDYNLVKFVVGK